MYILLFLICGLWVTGRAYPPLRHVKPAHSSLGVCVTIFQCTPISGAWDFTVEDRRCIDYVTYLYASSAVNVATDIVLCVLPLPHLWKLHLPLRERVVLCVLLAGGARYMIPIVNFRAKLTARSACVVGSVRIAFLGRLRVLDTTCEWILALVSRCMFEH